MVVILFGLHWLNLWVRGMVLLFADCVVFMTLLFQKWSVVNIKVNNNLFYKGGLFNLHCFMITSSDMENSSAPILLKVCIL